MTNLRRRVRKLEIQLTDDLDGNLIRVFYDFRGDL